MQKAVFSGGKFLVQDLTPEDLESIKPAPLTEPQYVAALQEMMDLKAKERNYDSILSACTYATSSIPKFALEGQACVVWRDAVWSTAYALLAEVQTGARPQPTMEELMALIPDFEWPDV